MLIAYYIITKSFGGIRLVSDVKLCNTWCRCYCTSWYLMLVAHVKFGPCAKRLSCSIWLQECWRDLLPTSYFHLYLYEDPDLCGHHDGLGSHLVLVSFDLSVGVY